MMVRCVPRSLARMALLCKPLKKERGHYRWFQENTNIGWLEGNKIGEEACCTRFTSFWQSPEEDWNWSRLSTLIEGARWKSS